MRVFNAARAATRHLSLIGLALLATLLLAACTTRGDDYPTSAGGPAFLPGKVVTQQGREAADLYLPIFLLAVAIFILVEGILLFVALRFRRKRGDDTLPGQRHGNNALELLWTGIPAIIVGVLFVVSTGVLLKVDAIAPNPAVTVDVTGFQWQWTFDYKDQGLSFTGAGKDGPEMVVPVDETIHIRLQSSGVIHSFYVPQFFRKLDVVPGRINEFQVNVEQEGTYGGQCAEFCGLAHADMYFTVRAVDRATFDQWVADEQAKVAATPPPAASGGPAAATLQVSAVNNLSFEQATLSAPADQPLTIDFANMDPVDPHNVSITAALPDGKDWIGLPIAQAGQNATYQVPALAAGEYTFYCSVHANMTGTLTVQ
ncbi:MAG: cytochrome c oxidase subunit II [Chloroflexi bacterium]|nr:cytochrome c oxidase subunit II [Chloroflexota bacterium]